ncbi:MAG: mandelate racemase/muconate lactonizing enzyme family protein [Nitratireductor sp.]
MAAIETIKTGFYRLSAEEVLVDAMHGEHHTFEVITVEVTDADGASGTGYTSLAGTMAVQSMISPAARSRQSQRHDADLIEKLWEKIWWTTHYGGRGGPTVLALSAFDIALWDLKAKRAGLPLWKLLGGYDPAVPCYAGGIDLHLSASQLIAQTERNVERGYRAIKMKVGREQLSEDVEKLAAMRRHFGDGFPIMVDANMKWTVAEAIRAARAFVPYNPVWLEEPIIPDDVEGYARVAVEGGLPVAMGENMRTIWEFRHAVTVGKIAFPEPDVTNCGGVTPFMKIAHMAEAFNLPVTSHGAHDITVHLLAAVPNRSYLEAHGFGLDEFIEEPLKIVDGKAMAPDRPGHGIVFDRKSLQRLSQH